MSERKNQCAFPASAEFHTEGGLTVRDYFAAMAMQGFIMLGHRNYENVAKFSIECADALIKELQKITEENK